MGASVKIPAPANARLVSTERAASWLDTSVHTFERMAEATGWLKPVRIGRKVLWDVVDLAVLGHLLSRQKQADTDNPRDEQ